MSALDEIATLEHHIHDMTKVVEEARLKVKQTEDEMKRHADNIEGARAKVTLYTGNVRHSKKKETDLVNLEEFGKTRQHLKHAREVLEEAESSMRECEKRKQRHQGIIERATRKIETGRKELKQYGQLRHFPKKDS